MSGNNGRQFGDRGQYNNQPRMDQGGYNFTPSQVGSSSYATSMSGRGNSEEDAQTRISSHTYTSDEGRTLLRQVDNRSFNALNEAYFLPSDSEEFQRLEKQHVAIVIALGGLYPMPEVVRTLLAPGTEGTKRILDLGCGTGIWAMEMAREFPHADVLGIDLAPVPVDAEHVLPNCRFEVDDINLGLSHFENQWDLIHVRTVVGGIHDYRKTMSDVHRCLKPGGMVIWIDADYDMYSGHQLEYLLPYSASRYPDGAAFHRITYEVRKAAMHFGRSDFVGMAKRYDEGLWDDPYIDPESCKAGSLFLPLGPWATHDDVHQAQRLKYVGSLMRQDLRNGQRAMHTILKKAGWPEETVNEWSRRTDEEAESDVHRMSVRLRLLWGRRRQSPGQPAPPLPSLAANVSATEDRVDVSPFPFLFIYDTPQELQQEAARRNAEKAIASLSPPPEPVPDPSTASNAAT